jgi:hypothetical protein
LKLALWKNGQSLPLLKEDALPHPQARAMGWLWRIRWKKYNAAKLTTQA